MNLKSCYRQTWALTLTLVLLLFSEGAIAGPASAGKQESPSPTARQSLGPKQFLTDEQNQLIGIAGLLLTLLALGIAVWQTKLAVSQNRDASKQAERLTEIADALSTKYIGPFPEYVAEIAEVLALAKGIIRILCSVPMHGIYNNPEGWLKSKQAIEAFFTYTDSDREVRCVFATKREREMLQRNQYKGLAGDWANWASNPENRRRLSSLVSRVAPKEPNAADTYEGFVDLLERAAERELRTTFERAVIREIEYTPPMFLWIADEKEAIFVLKTTYPSFRAEAFWTSDARLINSLITIHESYMLVSSAADPEAFQGAGPQ